jgi:hypothetical protein
MIPSPVHVNLVRIKRFVINWGRIYQQFMHPLFEIYEFLYPMTWSDSRWLAVGSETRGGMLVMDVWTVLCTAGTALYARLLVALRKEPKPRGDG